MTRTTTPDGAAGTGGTQGADDAHGAGGPHGSTADRAAGRRLAFRAALRELRGAQKKARGVSLYSRYVNRPAGRVLAAAAYRLDLTPDQVTLISAGFTFTGVGLLAAMPPSWALGAAVWAALAAGFAFDSADGQLARLLRRSSAAGEWLDHVVDCAKITALHAAVLVSFHRFAQLPSEGWLLLPLGFQLAAVLIFFGGLLTDKLRPRDAAAAPGAAAAPPSRVRAVALLPVDYGVFCLVFLLLGGAETFRWAYALLFAAHLVFLAGFLIRWYRELAARPAG
ncbi:CDP-alcohol phosphatidyltransferase family protein [Streptomyces sp. JJ36]|uniref:CDP-alcohol phosphatidyltransferase family protein n=1 Tax=Streptomyces sp. JJ36 TaxID=2736645 RepID=UPI001F17A6BE|nr:CDP-alcohol phosphatidyltransferase family protein [Streptomyces sp. JJ36]MCF6521860.1 CDP-alcohol phosphatidyltransferase family protein [Streptomyces sp. JJ36]